VPTLRLEKYLSALLVSCLSLFFLASGASGALSVNEPTYALTVVQDSDRGAEGTKVPYRRSVRPGETFRLAYTHSLDKCPIYEVLRVEKDASFTLLEEAYGWFGAGLEFNPETGFTRMGDGMIHILNIGRSLRDIPIRVGWICDFRLEFEDEIVPLTSLAPSGNLLWVKISRCP
jgi:hypothetical protein